MPLNLLDATLKPGRLPDAEQEGVEALLSANGWTDTDSWKATSDPAHRADLDARHIALMDVEENFGAAKLVPADRRRLRAELEAVYEQLLSAAEDDRDAATLALSRLIDDLATGLQQRDTSLKRLFKSPKGVWVTTYAPTIDVARIGPRILSFTSVQAVRDAVFKRFNALHTPPQPPPAFTAADQQRLDQEKAAVLAQVQAWTTKAHDAQGCNANGTWGTSATGVNPFIPSRLSRPVFNKLLGWWSQQAIPQAVVYVRPSRTTTHSLKMYRPSATLSEILNYHVDVIG